jgi:hypothetical protein
MGCVACKGQLCEKCGTCQNMGCLRKKMCYVCGLTAGTCGAMRNIYITGLELQLDFPGMICEICYSKLHNGIDLILHKYTRTM